MQNGAFGSDPFSSQNGSTRGFSSNGDPFKDSDFFSKTSQPSSADPFGAKDPFASAFGTPAKQTVKYPTFISFFTLNEMLCVPLFCICVE